MRAGRHPAAPSAGRLLREARERQGLHIAVLAASIKVTPKKLELLEADRFDALPDATFTRASRRPCAARSRSIRQRCLVLLPPPAGHRLEQVGEGLNAPFRERPGVVGQRDSAVPTLGPVFWVTAADPRRLARPLLPALGLAGEGRLAGPGRDADGRERAARAFAVPSASAVAADVASPQPAGTDVRRRRDRARQRSRRRPAPSRSLPVPS